MVLVDDFDNLTRTYCTATFADSETQTKVASNWSDELNLDSYVVTRHYHFNAFWKSDFTSYVEGTYVELWTIVVAEWSVTTTFLFSQDVNLSLEFVVWLNTTRVANNHTTLDFLLVDTTEEKTYVIASFTLIEELTEHFNTGNNRLQCSAKTHDLNFVTNLNDTSFDTTSCNSTTTSNREYVFNRHQEWLVSCTWRKLNPFVNSVHEVHNLFYPFRFAVQSTKCRAADDWSIFFEFILAKKVLHVHFNEFEKFWVVNHVTLVQEYNKTWNVYLASQKDVFTSLRHWTVSSSNYNDCTVHLSSTSYHVLNVVGVSRAVYVCIVTSCSFILDVSSVDSDTAFLFFRSVVNLVERLNFF